MINVVSLTKYTGISYRTIMILYFQIFYNDINPLQRHHRINFRNNHRRHLYRNNYYRNHQHFILKTRMNRVFLKRSETDPRKCSSSESRIDRSISPRIGSIRESNRSADSILVETRIAHKIQARSVKQTTSLLVIFLLILTLILLHLIFIFFILQSVPSMDFIKDKIIALS